MQTEAFLKVIPVYERRVLILDDNDGNRTLLNFVMQLNGIEHTEAATVPEVLRLWRPGVYSFAFLDIELPTGSGLDVARYMRTLDDGIAIIMCSTNDEPSIIEAAIEAGADLFIAKPFQIDMLMSFVKVMDRCTLRTTPNVLVVDNQARPHWHKRR